MHRPSPNIYEGELVDMMDGLYADLKSVACTTGDVAIYMGNGHAAWEAALCNVVQAGDHVLVLGSGAFAIGWGEMGTALGLDVEVLDFGKQSHVDPDVVLSRLAQDTGHQIKAVLVVQTDTASSVRNDIAAISQAIADADHPALYMVDCIATLGCEEFLMDGWNVDVMVAACQKGLMVPAGLSFVYVNPRGHAARAKISRVSKYWDWVPRTAPEKFRDLFGGTAPTHHLYGLREALNILVHEEGLEEAWARHRVLATAVCAAVDAWGAAGRMELNIADPNHRSFAVSAITTADGDAGLIRKWSEDVAGVTLGIGLGMAAPSDPKYNNYFRIGHMGYTNVPMVMGTLSAIDAALKANEIPHGPGALAVAASVIARG
jgi:alanine-glyoxylate transaminase/serine-glyoxylate transaminase/serine-pyruvate transaminase